MDNSLTIKLRRPVEAHGETLHEIVLREINTEDVIQIGVPVTVGKDGSGTMNTQLVMKYASRLGNIPPSTVRNLDARDFMDIINAVMGFFGEGTGENMET